MRVIEFTLDERDERLEEEITLAGVICSKIAKGDYVENPDRALLKAWYKTCSEMNEKLSSKINRIREVLED